MRIDFKNFAKQNAEATVSSIKHFKEQPLNSLGQLLPIGIICTSATGFVVSLIQFAALGGLSSQISMLKANPVDNLSQSFTSGTVGTLISGAVPLIITALFIAELTVFIISCRKTKKISEHGWMIKKTLVVLGLSCVAFPFLLLLIMNILPIVVGIIVIGFIFLICKLFFSASGTASPSSSEERTSESPSSSPVKEKPKERKNMNQKVKEYPYSTTFWRDKGGLGILTPQADCIYMGDKSTKTYVCTVQQFEKGEVAILHNGVRLINIAGCKTPER